MRNGPLLGRMDKYSCQQLCEQQANGSCDRWPNTFRLSNDREVKGRRSKLKGTEPGDTGIIRQRFATLDISQRITRVRLAITLSEDVTSNAAPSTLPTLTVTSFDFGICLRMPPLALSNGLLMSGNTQR